jgi:hypothetical protein
MANRSYLYISEYAEPYTDGIPEDQIVASGKYIIPVLWFTAFAASDIFQAIYDMEDEDTGEELEVPVAALRTTTDLALQRALACRAACFGILPDSLRTVYDDWLALLQGLERPYLFVELSELWMMKADEPYDDFLSTGVRAMDDFRLEDWQVLFDHAGIIYDPATRNVSGPTEYREDVVPYLLCGHSWIRRVPWEK